MSECVDFCKICTAGKIFTRPPVVTNIKSASELNDAFNTEELVDFINYLSQRPLSSKTIVFFREFGNVHAVQGALAEI